MYYYSTTKDIASNLSTIIPWMDRKEGRGGGQGEGGECHGIWKQKQSSSKMRQLGSRETKCRWREKKFFWFTLLDHTPVPVRMGTGVWSSIESKDWAAQVVLRAESSEQADEKNVGGVVQQKKPVAMFISECILNMIICIDTSLTLSIFHCCHCHDHTNIMADTKKIQMMAGV